MTGYDSKRQMAADKMQEPWNEDEWRRNNWRCGHGWLRGEQCEICNAAQPAQEPDYSICPTCGGITLDPIVPKLERFTPPQREWVGLTDDEIDYQAKKDDHGAYFALGALWAGAKLKEKNT